VSLKSRQATLDEDATARADALRRHERPVSDDAIVAGLVGNGVDPDQIQVMQFGQEMQAFIEKQPAGRYLIRHAEQQLAESVRKLLDLDSLDDTKARDAHFQARIAVGILRFIEDAVVSGQEAEDSIRAHDEVDDPTEISEPSDM
jgi:hypothetical protein